MASTTGGAAKAKAAKAKRLAAERAIRREAMAPIKAAIAREGRNMTWLRHSLASRAGMRVVQSTFYNYMSGWQRTTRTFVQAACLIAGANPGDVYARIAGQESVLFQSDTNRGQAKAAVRSASNER